MVDCSRNILPSYVFNVERKLPILTLCDDYLDHDGNLLGRFLFFFHSPRPLPLFTGYMCALNTLNVLVDTYLSETFQKQTQFNGSQSLQKTIAVIGASCSR